MLEKMNKDEEIIDDEVTEVAAKPKAKKTTKKPAHTENKITGKSNEEIVREVLDGKWGRGIIRLKKLKAAGYDYKTIQTLVKREQAKQM